MFTAHQAEAHDKRRNILVRPIFAFFGLFNIAFEWLSHRYGLVTAKLTRFTAIVLVVYAGLVGLTVFQFHATPTGFIPEPGPGLFENSRDFAAGLFARAHG